MGRAVLEVFFKHLIFIYVYECLAACMYAYAFLVAMEGRRVCVSGSLELEL